MKRLALAMLFCCLCLPMSAQSILQDTLHSFTKQLFEKLNDEDASSFDYEEFEDELISLSKNPVNLNGGNLDPLIRLGIITDYQSWALRDYISRYGELLSFDELKLVSGFSLHYVELLRHFSVIGSKPTDTSFADMFRKWSNDLLLKTKISTSKSDMEGSPFCRYLRYSGGGRAFSVNLTAESDAYERQFVDFLSANMQITDYKFIKKLVVGDYRASFGQGLVMWNGFSMNSSSSVADVARHASGIQGYRGSNESNFFRGGACTMELGSFEVSLFGSFRKLDANIVDGGFTSMPQTGYHRTDKERGTKGNLPALTGGANTTWNFRRGKIGVTSLVYDYGYEDDRRKSDYNRRQHRETPFGSTSVDALLNYKWLCAFGEFSIDYSGAMAYIAGVTTHLNDRFDCSILGRNYFASYTAPYSQALGQNSSNSNEYGVRLLASYSHGLQGKTTFFADFSRYPFASYGCKVPNTLYDLKLQDEGSIAKSIAYKVYYRYRSKLTGSDGQGRVQHNVQVKLPYTICESLSFTTIYGATAVRYSGEPLEYGVSAAGEVKLLYGGKVPLNIILHGGWFCTDSYQTRLYYMESDVLYGFSSPALYGKGYRWYVLVKYTPWKWCSIWLRSAYTNGKGEYKAQVRLTI